MKKQLVRICATVAAVMFLGLTVLEQSAHARAGGSRSSGSRGSRSYSAPTNSYSQPSPSASPYRQPVAPAAGAFGQQQRGGFLRSMAGGMVGGLLGGMLFRSMGFAGFGGMGGGGIGLFEIILLAGIGYLIYRYLKNRRQVAAPAYADGASHSQPGSFQTGVSHDQGGYQGGQVIPISDYRTELPASDALASGLSQIRRTEPSFDEGRFNDAVMDMFFRIQGSWMNRDVSPVLDILTEEMRREFQEELDRLRSAGRINKLENIAVRNVEITEAWQESGQDFLTVLIYANLLDYTTDERSGAVVAGSKTEPVKFEEFWTFTRSAGRQPWRLSGINQR